MSTNATFARNITMGGKTVAEQVTVTAEASLLREPSLPAAKVGNLTTRTDNTTGTLTMSADHGFVTGNKLDIYWNTPTPGTRRQVDVGTVATNSVPFSGGTGDNLPTGATPAITAMVPVSKEIRFDGDDAVVLAFGSSVPAICVLAPVANTEAYAFAFPTGGQADGWRSGAGKVNPIAGVVITQAFLSHGDSTGAKTVTLLVHAN